MVDGPERERHKFTPWPDPNAARLNLQQTADYIEHQIGLRLEVSRDFCIYNEQVILEMDEEHKRLSDQYGVENVLTSCYMDEKGDMRLGLFVRGADPSAEG